MDVNDCVNKSGLLAHLMEYITDWSKKVDSPLLSAIAMLLSSLLAFVANFSTAFSKSECKIAFESLSLAFQKMATLIGQANNPTLVKNFADTIIDYTSKFSGNNSSSSNNASISNGYILEWKLINQYTDGNSSNAETLRIAINNGDIDYDSPSTLASSISNLRANLHHQLCDFLKRTVNIVTRGASLEQVQGEETKIQQRQCVSFEGIYDIYLPDKLNKEYTNTEYIWDPLLLFNLMDAIANMSYRKGTNLVNNLLELHGDERINYRTVHHICCSIGEEIDKYIEDVLLPVLKQHGFDSDGLLVDSSKLAQEIIHPFLNHTKSEEMEQKVVLAAEEYNKNITDEDEKISPETCSNTLIIHPKDEISISVDIILTKAQKKVRRKKGQKLTVKKKQKYISSTVVSITTADGTMQLVADTTYKALKMALALMLKNDLLLNKALVFYTDGQKEINQIITTLFGFRSFSIKLD